MCKRILPCNCFKECKGTGDIFLPNGEEDLCPCACHEDEDSDYGSGDNYEDQGDRD